VFIIRNVIDFAEWPSRIALWVMGSQGIVFVSESFLYNKQIRENQKNDKKKISFFAFG
jgi:hypothetical protein